MKINLKKVCLALLSAVSISMTGCSIFSIPDAVILQSERYPQYSKYLKGNDYTAYTTEDGTYIAFVLTKEELASIPYRDMQIFFRNLRYIYSDSYIYCTLVFGDGTGICFENCDPEKGTYGDLDSATWHTSAAKGLVTDTGSYLTLCDENGNPLNSSQDSYGINGIKNE